MKQLLGTTLQWKGFTRVAAALLALATLAQRSPASVVVYGDLPSFNAATNTTLIEDFEDPAIPHDTPLAGFVHNGNTYTGLGGSPFPNVYDASAGYTNFGVPVTTSSVLTANGDEDFTVAFGAPPRALGFDTYLNRFTFPDGHQGHVEVFGTSGLLATVNVDHDPTMVGFLGLVADEPITSIRWTTVGGGQINTGIDNIREGTLATPEPASLLLLGIGIAGMAGYAWRRKQWANVSR